MRMTQKENILALRGKTIEKARIEGIPDHNDRPYLYLEMTDGSVFEIVADYGGYTGNSEDEYPRLIRVKLVTVSKEAE